MANKSPWRPGQIRDKAALKARYKLLLQPVVFQGDDRRTMRMQDSPFIAAGANLPSGSICMIDDQNIAKAYDSEAIAANAVPNFVMLGTENEGVSSQEGNIAGGIITTYPVTGYYRFQTQLFDKSKTYARNEFLTVAEYDFDGFGKVTGLVNGATPYTDVVAGIVCKPVYNDAAGRATLTFDAYFLPKQG
jgi:hypothetical protein